MKVGVPSLQDLPAMVALGQVCHEESRFAALRYDAERVYQRFVRMVEQPLSTTFFVAAWPTQQGERAMPCGLMIGTIDEYFFSAQTVASSVFLLVHPEQRGGLAAVKMVSAFRAWARRRAASEVYIGVASGVHMRRTGRFLTKLGLHLSGGNYSTWLAAPNDRQVALSATPAMHESVVNEVF